MDQDMNKQQDPGSGQNPQRGVDNVVPDAEVARDGDMDLSPGVPSGLDRLVGEHEEEVSENGRTVRRKGVYLLPNLFTTGALFAGFYAVVAGMRDNFEAAPIAIFFAMVLDGLDGRIARLTNTSSKFGAEYDSLADMVSFGVAPALVVFSWGLSDLGKRKSYRQVKHYKRRKRWLS